MTQEEEQQQLARAFLSVLRTPDADVIRRVAAEDVVWSFPGSMSISGIARGVDGVIGAGTDDRRVWRESGDHAGRVWPRRRRVDAAQHRRTRRPRAGRVSRGRLFLPWQQDCPARYLPVRRADGRSLFRLNVPFRMWPITASGAEPNHD
jgi:ketosteroid isomerase-like protein